MIARDVIDFGLGSADLDRRMLHGGLPPFFLGDAPDDEAFGEWMDSYWAKDLQELFVVEKKGAFFKLVELLFRQSGGLFDAQSFTGPCEVSRQTVRSYLEILETTLLATVLRPFSGGSTHEIVHQPKVFMFDTGFTAYFRGWSSLRDEDRGLLLEHLVLGELQARFARATIHHWRDKQKHEVDFVVKPARGTEVTAIECKATARAFDPAALTSFRKRYPAGKNLLVCLDAVETTARRIGPVVVEIIPYLALGQFLDASP